MGVEKHLGLERQNPDITNLEITAAGILRVRISVQVFLP